MARWTSRREFLRRSTLVAAGVLGAPYVARAGNAGERLKMAVVGAGGRGRAGMGAARDEQLVAVADVDAKRAGKSLDQAKKQFPQLKVYSDYREMLDKHKGLDAV